MLKEYGGWNIDYGLMPDRAFGGISRVLFLLMRRPHCPNLVFAQ
jgi:hypothetical protein